MTKRAARARNLLTSDGADGHLGVLSSTADEADLDGSLDLTRLPLDSESLAGLELSVVGRAGNGVEAGNLGHGRDREGQGGSGDSSETHLD